MKTVDLSIGSVVAPDWNPNEMDEPMRNHLRQSIRRFGFLVPLVVRDIGDGTYETIGGSQRLAVLVETGATEVPCVLVRANNAEARLLSQALNHIAGEDNPGLRAEVIRDLLDAMSQDELLAILPDSVDDLRTLASVGEADLAEHLQAWELAQAARLHHLQVQLTDSQLGIVENALKHALAGGGTKGGNPNRRGNALVAICRAYLALQGGRDD